MCPAELKICTNCSFIEKVCQPQPKIKNCFWLVAIQGCYQELLTEKQTLSYLHIYPRCHQHLAEHHPDMES